jgi:hypothetical protein
VSDPSHLSADERMAVHQPLCRGEHCRLVDHVRLGGRQSTLTPGPGMERCLREHLSDLQKRNICSASILAVFQQYCYVPKHTVGDQLLQVREAKREQAAYDSATLMDR